MPTDAGELDGFASGRPATSLAEVTRYDRHDHGDGIVSWVYEYWNTDAIDHRGLTGGLELAVQLAGEWLHAGFLSGSKLCRHTHAYHLNQGERFDVRFEGAAHRGVQVGFAIYPRELPEYRGDRDELVFPRGRFEVDRRFYAFCEHLRAHRSNVSSREIRDEVRAYVARTCESVSPDPILVGKRELEQYFDRELSMRHVAEAADLHPVTFARRFKRRFGLSPLTYRQQWRLHHAARLLWSRPELAIEEIAETSGHNQLPYFYRIFRRQFGETPGAYRARALQQRTMIRADVEVAAER